MLLVVGLDGAGKTTWLHRLQTGNTPANTLPTVVSNYEDFTYKDVAFGLWDLGGQNVYRSLWKYHLSGAKGLLFVLDSTDRLRIHEAKQELFDLLAEDKLREALLVVLANKQVSLAESAQLTAICTAIKFIFNVFSTFDFYIDRINRTRCLLKTFAKLFR